MLNASIAVLNSKGGVGKSSLSAQLSGLAAHSGWHVLCVEMDAQGNLARDFGALSRSDDGAALLRAVRDEEPLQVVSDVRPNLDWVPGGSRTVDVYAEFASFRDGVAGHHRLLEVLAPVSENYDLVVIDSPPGEAAAQAAIMNATRWLVCPSETDEGSLDGLATALTRAAKVRTTSNPGLEVLGVVLTRVAGKARVAEAKDKIAERSGSRLKVYEPPLRNAKAVADACRHHGLLVHEIEMASAQQEKKLNGELGRHWYYKLEKSARAAIRRIPDGHGLADDYQKLVTAILDDVTARLSA